MSLAMYRVDGPAALFEPHWPDKVLRFVWRNWPLVAVQRLSEVLDTDVATVEAVARSMGLPVQEPIPPQQPQRSYFTIIRRNWHELPYEQLLKLLGWSEQRLATVLKEEDFLWVKLGSLKPKCTLLRYEPPTPKAARRADQIRATIDEQFDDPWAAEPRFEFIRELSSDPEGTTAPAAPEATDERANRDRVSVDSNWCLSAPTGPASAAVAQRFAQRLRAAHGVDLTPQAGAPGNGRQIRLEVDASNTFGFQRPESHYVLVEPSGVTVTGASDVGVMRGLQFIGRAVEDQGSPSLPIGAWRREARFWMRVMHGYLPVHGDPLSEPELNIFPDPYLQRLSDLGVNGVWFQGLLRLLAPSRDFPEFGDGWQVRLDNLRRLVEKAGRYGIGIWFYFNEPRAMPAEFFRNHQEVAGVDWADRGGTALCTSTEPVKRFLVESTEHLFREVPDLAGILSITASENLTNCAMTGKRVSECPRCSQRDPADVIAEVSRLITEGVRRGSPSARYVSWDWGWWDEVVQDIVDGLPPDASLMSVSEWNLPIKRGGVDSVVGEYSVTVVGPGPRATRHWQLADRRGLDRVAKIQVNNSWEFSASPYMLAADNIAHTCQNLAEAGVSGLMLGWTLGGWPSLNMQVAAEFYFGDAQDADDALSTVARRRYGPRGAEEGAAAWAAAAVATDEYPFSLGVVYNAPVQMGAANLLYAEPTGYGSTMTGIGYDAVKNWSGPYPPPVLADQFAKVAAGLAAPIEKLGRLAADVAEPFASRAREDRDMALAAQTTFASVANQVRFTLGRDELRQTNDQAEALKLIDSLEALVRDERQVARTMHDLASRDSRIGYESSNHYFYLPCDLKEKVLCCQWLLDEWVPEQRKRWEGTGGEATKGR